MKITILGAGTWGIALARVLSNAGHGITVWSALKEEITDLNERREHKNLPGMKIPMVISFQKDIGKAMENSEMVLMAVPSVYVRKTAEVMKPFLKDNEIIITVAKGLEEKTLFTMSEVIQDVTSDEHPIVALSGPTHAEEVAKDMPTLIVAASHNEEAAMTVQGLFRETCLRVYTNPDIFGVELCGALKNVVALSCGIANGLGLGDNTKAAIMTRGMKEISRLGISMGALSETFTGLAGIGDLIVTATSEHSRNNRCGRYIGQGMKAQEAVKEVGMVVEGINALPAAKELATRQHVEMPIIDAIYEIVYHNSDPKDVVSNLLNRKVKSELSI